MSYIILYLPKFIDIDILLSLLFISKGIFVEEILYLFAVTVRNLDNGTSFELTGSTVLTVTNPYDGMTLL
jgi:hypothetical protein